MGKGVGIRNESIQKGRRKSCRVWYVKSRDVSRKIMAKCNGKLRTGNYYLLD